MLTFFILAKFRLVRVRQLLVQGVMKVMLVNLMSRGIWVRFWHQRRFVKRLFSARFLRSRLMKMTTCAWMLLHMVSDCSMSRSGRNDDEFLVFRSLGPIRTVKFREVFLSVGDCDALRKPEKFLDFTRCCLIVAAKRVAGAPTEKNASVFDFESVAHTWRTALSTCEVVVVTSLHLQPPHRVAFGSSCFVDLSLYSSF